MNQEENNRAIEFQRMFTVDEVELTERYQVVFYSYSRKYLILDKSLDEVIFEGKASEIKAFIAGFVTGRTTMG